MLQCQKALQNIPSGTTKRHGADNDRNSDSQSNTVSGCPWLRMNIHKPFFSSIVVVWLSRYAQPEGQFLRNIS
jgi:hypothetical protein